MKNDSMQPATREQGNKAAGAAHLSKLSVIPWRQLSNRIVPNGDGRRGNKCCPLIGNFGMSPIVLFQ